MTRCVPGAALVLGVDVLSVAIVVYRACCSLMSSMNLKLNTMGGNVQEKCHKNWMSQHSTKSEFYVILWSSEETELVVLIVSISYFFWKLYHAYYIYRTMDERRLEIGRLTLQLVTHCM